MSPSQVADLTSSFASVKRKPQHNISGLNFHWTECNLSYEILPPRCIKSRLYRRVKVS